MNSYLVNAVGEVEREARSRRLNVVEPLLFACWILGVLWPFCFAFGVLPGNDAIRNAGTWPLAIAFAWVMLLSPWWHRDNARSLGLGSPSWIIREIGQRSGLHRWQLLGPVLLLFFTLLLVSVANWPETARMFRLGSGARLWPIAPGGPLKMLAFSGIMSAIVTCCVIRWDNLASALRPVLIAAAALLIYAASAAFLNHGRAAFATIDQAQYPLDVLAYAFWGTLQQFLFTAYFSTRLRKGIPPGHRSPTPAWNTGILFGGVSASSVLAPSVWMMVRSLSGPENATLSMLAGCVIFAFPVGAIWTHFYLRDRRRMLVATLSGSFFGLIHIDSYGLVLVTFGLGTIFAYLFMEDRYRNLAVIGCAHGLLGSTFGKFFKNEAAGALKVGYRVGPWNVEQPTSSDLVVPLLCLALYGALLVWALLTPLLARLQPSPAAQPRTDDLASDLSLSPSTARDL